MAHLIQQGYRRSLFSISKTLIPQLHKRFPLQSDKHISNILHHNRFSTSTIPQKKSPFESNLLRLLCNEIEFESDYAPPHKPATKFNAFSVEGRPGEQYVTLRGKSACDENIKIETTMFNGSDMSPKSDDDSTGDDVQLHISLLVDVSKGEGCDLLEFACSAWPDRLEIQKVYVFSPDGSLSRPYTGPNFRDLNKKLQRALYEFLKARGVNDDLSVFLHQYMLNKDKIEHIQCLKFLKSYIEK